MASVLECVKATGDDNLMNSSWPAYLYYDNYFGNDVSFKYESVLYVLNDIFPLLLTLASIFGNITIIVTLMMKKNRIFSTASFFISLAATDLIATIAGPFITWSPIRFEIWNYDMECRIDTIFIYASKYISSFNLAFISVERAISVCLPHKVKLICSPKLAKFILTALWVSSFSFSIFVEVHMGAQFGQGYVYCPVVEYNVGNLFYIVYPGVSLLLEFFIPFFVILTSSLIIINQLYLRSKTNVAAKRTRMKYITLTLINVNVGFILTKLPWSSVRVYNTIRQLQDPCWDSGDPVIAIVLNTSLILIDNLNHALNFYIYFLSGSQFRNDVKTLMIGLFKKCRH